MHSNYEWAYLFLIKARAKKEHCISLILSDHLEAKGMWAQGGGGGGGGVWIPSHSEESWGLGLSLGKRGKRKGPAAGPCSVPAYQGAQKVPFPPRLRDGKTECMCVPWDGRFRSNLRNFCKELWNWWTVVFFIFYFNLKTEFWWYRQTAAVQKQCLFMPKQFDLKEPPIKG